MQVLRNRPLSGRAMAAWVALTAGVIAFSACGLTEQFSGSNEAHEEHADHDAESHAGDNAAGDDETGAGQDDHSLLEIPEEAQQNAGMSLVTAAQHEIRVPMTVTGVVTPVTSRVIHLRPLAEGIVKQVDVKLGDRVKAGQILVTYDNVALGNHIGEFLSAVAARRQAEAELLVRERSFERATKLIELEAIAQQTLDLRRSEFEQARASLVSAQAEVHRIEEHIHRFGLTDQDLEEVAPTGSAEAMDAAAERHRQMSLNVLRAPFDGIVTESGVAVGDVVTPDRELLTLTDLSMVWVLADVYEPDLGRVPASGEVEIQLDAYPDRSFTGRITYISDTIEVSTRAAHVRCVVANPNYLLKLGMFATVTIPTNERISTLAAPIDAVQHIDGQPVVFVRTGPTSFERRDVALGSTAGGMVEVVSGLTPGESIVSTGSFYLKTASLHERIGHSH